MTKPATPARMDAFQQGRYDAIFAGKTLDSPCPYNCEAKAKQWREGVLDALGGMEIQRQLDAETAKVMRERR